MIISTVGGYDRNKRIIKETFYGEITVDVDGFEATAEYEGEMFSNPSDIDIRNVKVTRCHYEDVESGNTVECEITKDMISASKADAQDWYDENFYLAKEWAWVEHDTRRE